MLCETAAVGCADVDDHALQRGKDFFDFRIGDHFDFFQLCADCRVHDLCHLELRRRDLAIDQRGGNHVGQRVVRRFLAAWIVLAGIGENVGGPGQRANLNLGDLNRLQIVLFHQVKHR